MGKLFSVGIRKADQREFAIKRFNLEGLDDGTVEGLREEARTLQALTHPYLIRVYGIVETSDELSVVCERCTGGHFRERVMRRRIGENMRTGQGRYRCRSRIRLGEPCFD